MDPPAATMPARALLLQCELVTEEDCGNKAGEKIKDSVMVRDVDQSPLNLCHRSPILW